ncbi:MAG: glycoside hydrolase [Thiomicrospira sp.]|uniref:glycoside hydrolase family 57 protein n=1 Tax=Thiomicrospira sp. TaxID=935 RepID=UPI001A0A0938|nr:glycoside hydrolase family 57 protein [Thiomicrospira sp.]MBE0493793.1 glycoside hydrolase [Thiomicrospira sp.]
MHQPHYRDGLDGQYRLPWVYLHAMKDYTDMAAYLEANPEAKVVVNFAPVLLEQIDDYAAKMQAWLSNAQAMPDDFLNLLAGAEPIPQDLEQRKKLVEACQRAFAPTMIDSLPAYRHLIDMIRPFSVESEAYEQTLMYLNEGFYIDLLVWYHLAWTGVSVRQKDTRIQYLLDKKQGFDSADQRLLVEAMADNLQAIIPRYRRLMECNQIELSMTPYGHPIVPLLIDFDSMLDALPKAPVPNSPVYPGGYERACWHMEHGLEVFDRHFGCKPQGVWLSEGAVSSASIGMLDHYGIKWTASGEGVWRHSCEASHLDLHDIASKRALYQPLQHATQNCALFFRDDGLSDLIGFQYKDWNPVDAANDFAQHLNNIANFLGDKVEEHVVSVILDGENAWEYYPDNGFHFLTALYERLTHHPIIQMTTFSDALAQGVKVRHLPTLKAGSWVYGSFSTWIGEPEKNRAWDILVEAKQTYDRVKQDNKLSQAQLKLATEQLAICEGSDWFWWFGDYNPGDSVRDFDQLYRRHLEKLYELLNEPVPAYLDTPISQGGGNMENAGTMRRN